MKDSVVFLGCGDVGPIHEPMEAYSTLVRPVLATGDIRFAQCERLYSERESRQAHTSSAEQLKPHLASVFSDCGFNVVSLASNQSLKRGEDVLLDTIALFQKKGIQTIGAGRNLEEARQPALIEKNGVRIAILGYCWVLPEGYAAGPSKVGIAPLRAYTYYRPLEYQPGLPPKVVTVPYEEDLEAMVQDINNARKTAHAVVVSFHWGIHFIPRAIADYQPAIAKAAFAAGADLIVGHHPHIPKAIGVHSGKVCFYSLSNFIMSSVGTTTKHTIANAERLGVVPEPDYPNFPYGPDGKRSLIAKAVLSREGVQKVSFLPVLIDRELRPEVLHHGDPRFDDAVNYMDWASDGFNHQFTFDGDEVLVAVGS